MTAKKTTKPKQQKAKKPNAALALAMLFHDTYERLAPKFGYKTRDDTKEFIPNGPNGKLMVAVAKEVLASIPKPPPEKIPITEADHEKWFYNLDAKHFKLLAQEWNEQKLKLKLVKQDGYDAWLNYFKTLSPTAIRMLAATGQDILTTEAYAALSWWHDIISNPHRIGKIHQAGLNGPARDKKTKTIYELAQANDRLGVLMATRDAIAEKLQKGAGARDTAALARELTEIMTQIADYEKRMGPKKTTVLGQLLEDMPGPKTKRPSKNGGGARHTSFKSRVTIKDIEDGE